MRFIFLGDSRTFKFLLLANQMTEKCTLWKTRQMNFAIFVHIFHKEGRDDICIIEVICFMIVTNDASRGGTDVVIGVSGIKKYQQTMWTNIIINSHYNMTSCTSWSLVRPTPKKNVKCISQFSSISSKFESNWKQIEFRSLLCHFWVPF